MNKIIKKAIACTLVAGTVLAGSTIALNTPAQAASYSKNESYYFCSGKHAYAKLTNVYKQKGTISLKASGKNYSFKYEVKSGKESARKKVSSNKYTSTKNVYLYINGKKTDTMQTITYYYKSKTATKAYDKKVKRNHSQETRTTGPFTLIYTYDTDGSTLLTIQQSKCSSCKTCANGIHYTLKDGGFTDKCYSRESKINLGNGYYLEYYTWQSGNKIMAHAEVSQSSKTARTHSHYIDHEYSSGFGKECGSIIIGNNKNPAITTSTYYTYNNKKTTSGTEYTTASSNKTKTIKKFYDCTDCKLKMNLGTGEIKVKAPGTKTVKTYYTKMK